MRDLAQRLVAAVERFVEQNVPAKADGKKEVLHQEKLHPMGNRIMVRLDTPEMEVGGIIIPDLAKQVPEEGIVVELGDQNIDMATTRRIPWNVRVGQRLLITKFGGYRKKVTKEGKTTEYQFIIEGDVVAVLD